MIGGAARTLALRRAIAGGVVTIARSALALERSLLQPRRFRFEASERRASSLMAPILGAGLSMVRILAAVICCKWPVVRLSA